MAISVWELAKSPERTKGSNPTVTLLYAADGDDDDALILAAVETAAPSTYAGLIRRDLRARNVDGRADLWEVSVEYAPAAAIPPDPPETGESSFSFNTSGGTENRKFSRATVDSDTTLAATPDFYKAIGVDGTTVVGVDAVVPRYEFSETHYIADASVTSTYKGYLFSLTGKVNNASFKGFAAGEVLFLGASGSKRGAGDWEINFQFAASPNVTGLDCGNGLSVDKKGWEYVWLLFETTEDATAKILTRTVSAAYVEEIYASGDFSLLGIGT